MRSRGEVLDELSRLRRHPKGVVRTAKIDSLEWVLDEKAERPMRCGYCVSCEITLFTRWLSAIEALPTLGPRELVNEDCPRMSLITELHASLSSRYPLGIARTISSIIDMLDVGDDGDAMTQVGDLLVTERESLKLNPNEPTCDRETIDGE